MPVKTPVCSAKNAQFGNHKNNPNRAPYGIKTKSSKQHSATQIALWLLVILLLFNFTNAIGKIASVRAAFDLPQLKIVVNDMSYTYDKFLSNEAGWDYGNSVTLIDNVSLTGTQHYALGKAEEPTKKFASAFDLGGNEIKISSGTDGVPVEIKTGMVGFFGEMENTATIKDGYVTWNTGIGTIPEGSGTQSDPYTIDSMNDLLFLSMPNSWDYITGGKYYSLTCDIVIDYGSNLNYDANNYVEKVRCVCEDGEYKKIREPVLVDGNVIIKQIWNSIGTSTHVFNGNFNGNGHTIKLKNVSEPLFGICELGSVYNLGTEVISECYTITYNLSGGEMSDAPTEYSSTTESFILPTPTKRGCTFLGWTGSNGDIPQTEIVITKGSKGNRVYTANWQQTTAFLTLTCTNFIDQKFAIYVFLGEKIVKQIYVDKKTIEIELNLSTENSEDKYTLAFVFGYLGTFNVPYEDNASIINQITVTKRKVWLDTLSSMSILYTLSNPAINSTIII